MIVGEGFRAATELWWDKWGYDFEVKASSVVCLFKKPRMNKKIELVGEELSFI